MALPPGLEEFEIEDPDPEPIVQLVNPQPARPIRMYILIAVAMLGVVSLVAWGWMATKAALDTVQESVETKSKEEAALNTVQESDETKSEKEEREKADREVRKRQVAERRAKEDAAKRKREEKAAERERTEVTFGMRKRVGGIYIVHGKQFTHISMDRTTFDALPLYTKRNNANEMLREDSGRSSKESLWTSSMSGPLTTEKLEEDLYIDINSDYCYDAMPSITPSRTFKVDIITPVLESRRRVVNIVELSTERMETQKEPPRQKQKKQTPSAIKLKKIFKELEEENKEVRFDCNLEQFQKLNIWQHSVYKVQDNILKSNDKLKPAMKNKLFIKGVPSNTDFSSSKIELKLDESDSLEILRIDPNSNVGDEIRTITFQKYTVNF